MFSDEDIQSLGELGMVSVVAFETLEREDTGNYSCTATNSLPGGQTGTEMVDSSPIPLTVLGKEMRLFHQDLVHWIPSHYAEVALFFLWPLDCVRR